MPAYVVYGDPVFTTVEARDEVAVRVAEIAEQFGLVPSKRMAGFSPGVGVYDYVDPWGAGTLPGVRFAYQGTDQQVINDASAAMGDVIYPLDPQAGACGTWLDMSL